MLQHGLGVRRWLALLVSLTLVLCALPLITAAHDQTSSPRSLHASSLCTNLIVNGGFEDDPATPAPWLTGGFTVISEQRVRSGNLAVWMGGYKNARDTLSQVITLPDGDSLTLRYWVNIHTHESSSTPSAQLLVSLRTPQGAILEVLQVLDDLSDRDVWMQSSHDLYDYRGQTLAVHFQCLGFDDAQAAPVFFVDDVELEVCGAPGETATPTPTGTATAIPSQRRYMPLVLRSGAD